MNLLYDLWQVVWAYFCNKDEQIPPAHGWVCFHCGARFRTVAGAQIHFGKRPSEPAGCTIDIEEFRNMRYELHAARVKLIRAGR